MTSGKKSKQKPLNSREKQKYPNLKKMYNTKIRQDLLDQDYIDKLSDSEKAWLDRFNKEFINATFEKKKKYTKNNLHKGEKKRKELYKDNYSRQNCLYNVKKATKSLVSIEGAFNKTQNTNVEDALIDVIDAKNYVNALEKPSVTKLARSERKHSTMAKLRKKADKAGNNSDDSSGNQ
jgi:hypothetical protein